jgi:hypothetical protein
MRLRRLLRLAPVAATLAVAVALGACGENGDEARKALAAGRNPPKAVREGLSVPVDGVWYDVFITRPLNLSDPEDRQYYQGPEAPPRSELLGVFIQVCNRSGTVRRTASDFSIVDTQGAEYRPLPLPRSNPFAYQPTALPVGKCLPDRESAVSYSPTGGVLLLFRIPLSAEENRPLELAIAGAVDPATGRRQIAKVDLDI